ncbi:MAG: SDR family oxidoreductase [Verrucomicrobia bacterium]|nr:SDR family oxidoreductase [Verrucomicrobiota bacterium]
MDLKLQRKRALITGSSSGIGQAIARTLALEGVSVVIHGRDRKRAEHVSEEITTAGGKATVAVGDLSTESGSRQVAQASVAAFGGLDILVNNAGGADRAPITWEGENFDEWAESFQQNFFSAVRLASLLLPELRTNGWGRIIQITTGWASHPENVAVDYAAAKAAVSNTSASLTRALAGTGVTVNNISPGPIVTPALERTMRGIAAQRGWGDEWPEIERRAVAEIVPNSVGRMGHVEDIANAVAFLASPLADYIDGATLRVDGGRIPSTF